MISKKRTRTKRPSSSIKEKAVRLSDLATDDQFKFLGKSIKYYVVYTTWDHVRYAKYNRLSGEKTFYSARNSDMDKKVIQI